MQNGNPMEFNFEGLGMQKPIISTNGAQRVDGKHWSISLVIMFTTRVMVTETSKMAHFCIFYR